MTPDNSAYYIAAYVAAAAVYGGYILSVVIRTRRARERMHRQQAMTGASGTPRTEA